ncbi:MAG: peptide deformylase [Candidatus Berkelbacteria bacterium]|nr:peptide deformylase [Candidatus Berkelbacteria bacterium]
MEEILTRPDPKLKTKAAEVEKIDNKTKGIVSFLWSVKEKSDALGLAATQLGIHRRIMVIGYEPTEKQKAEDPSLRSIPRITLINPKIIDSSKRLFTEKEACLSCPNEQFEVPRSKKISLEYLDEKGKKRKLKARGFLARIIQHEIDHLNGKVIADYKNPSVPLL